MKFVGIKLHSGQKRIVGEILNSPAKFCSLNCSRQYGKSVLAIQLILYYAINFPNTRNFYGTPFHSQAKKVFTKVINSILKSGIVKEYNKSDMTITLINNSVILFSGVERYDNLRGETIFHMIIDEASFIRNEAFTEALRPMLLVKGRKCILISTPKGKKNLFFKLSQLGMADDQPNYSYHFGTYTENPFYNLEEIEDARRNLPIYIFRQEYLGEFIDAGAEIFVNIDEVFCLKDYAKPTSKNYAGLDLGRKNDYTVLTVMNNLGEVIEIYRDNKKSWDEIMNNVAAILKKHNAHCLVETNGIGDVVCEILKKKYSKIEAFITSNSSKQTIIEQLIVDFQNLSIKLPNESLFKYLKDEIEALEVEYNVKTRNIFYRAPQGLHDDCVMSAALCNYNRIQKKNSPTYAY
jgi:phage FluMu gp28-like protein